MDRNDFHKMDTLPGFPGEKDAVIPEDLPETIGPYQIEALLDTGGMSLIYIGVHPETKQATIVKVLSPKYLQNPEATQRFLKESNIFQITDHPNIVKLYDHGKWEGGLYIAMEYIEGVSLRNYLLQNPISLRRALEIALDIAYALCHLHSHGIIHRDMKPENVLVTKTGEIKVIDFGIAQFLQEQQFRQGAAGPRVVGTPIYMSPEQQEDPASVSYPSDIYSLGIMLYELVLGRPCRGKVHLSLMPGGIQKILTKALQPRPEDRYLDLVDLIADLSAYLESPDLEKEKKAGDPVSELFENLKLVQRVLSPIPPENWKDLDIGIADNQEGLISDLYYDFLTFKDGSRAILVGIPESRQEIGVIYSAILRGTIRSLYQLVPRPMELLTILNDLFYHDPLNRQFHLSYLHLDPELKKATYASSGQGRLWCLTPDGQQKLETENPPLGQDKRPIFVEETIDLPEEWTLLLDTFTPQEDLETRLEKLNDCLSEYKTLTPQHLSETTLRLLKSSGVIHRGENASFIAMAKKSL